MRRRKDEMMSIDPDGFFAEYKRISKAFGGVEALSKKVAPDCHEHYLSVAKRQARVARFVFENLAELGADKRTMLGKKPKPYTCTGISELMYQYLIAVVTSDAFKETFIRETSSYLRTAVNGGTK